MHIITGHLPIRPILLRFIEWSENLKPGEALDLDTPTPLRLAIFAYFTNQKSIAFDREASIPSGYRDRLAFCLDIDTGKASRGAYFYSNARVVSINNLIYSFLIHGVRERVRLLMGFGKTEKDIIYEFIREAGLNEDDFDMIKKAAYRLRTEKLGEQPFVIHEKYRQRNPSLFCQN